MEKRRFRFQSYLIIKRIIHFTLVVFFYFEHVENVSKQKKKNKMKEQRQVQRLKEKPNNVFLKRCKNVFNPSL